IAFADFIERNPREFALLLTLWVATALAYPTIRVATAWFVDTILLRRPNYRALRTLVSSRVQLIDDIPGVLSTICDLIGPSLSSPEVTWAELDPLRSQEPSAPLVSTGRDAVTRVLVPTAESPRFVVTIAPLTRGRRLLSDDVGTLEAIVTTAAR